MKNIYRILWQNTEKKMYSTNEFNIAKLKVYQMFEWLWALFWEFSVQTTWAMVMLKKYNFVLKKFEKLKNVNVDNIEIRLKDKT